MIVARRDGDDVGQRRQTARHIPVSSTVAKRATIVGASRPHAAVGRHDDRVRNAATDRLCRRRRGAAHKTCGENGRDYCASTLHE